jgi:hypothetical protein
MDRLREKNPHCHSERSEESLPFFLPTTEDRFLALFRMTTGETLSSRVERGVLFEVQKQVHRVAGFVGTKQVAELIVVNGQVTKNIAVGF